MEGTLLKRTTNNVWHSRKFKLERSTLSWLKSDNTTTIQVDLSKECTLRDIKFGPKKFAFEIVFPRNPNGTAGDVIALSASGEAEKAAWMSALSTAMGKKKEADAIFTNSVAAHKSVRKSQAPSKPAAAVSSPVNKPSTPATAAASKTPGTPTTSSGGGGFVDLVNQASASNNKLAAKIGGRVMVSTQTLCAVCSTPVYKMEELIVDKATMHKKCFQCNHCKRQLTMGNFACINSTFYCKVHYFELFSQSGGKYEKAFGDAGFEKKALNSYTPPTANGGVAKAPGSIPPKPAVAAQKPTTTTTSTTEVPIVQEVEAEKQAVAVANKKSDSPPKKVNLATATATKTPSVIVASKESPPKKPEVSKPVMSPPVVVQSEPVKPKLEVLPKKNMDELRKLVRLPGMGGPPPQSPTRQEQTDATNATASPTTNKEDVTFQIKPPPMGINFALEAVKKRQAQLGITAEIPSEEDGDSDVNVFAPAGAVRNSVRGSNRLDHSAQLNRPKVNRRRAAPKVQEVGKALAKTIEVDKIQHDCTFKLLLNGLVSTSEQTLVLHATSLFERDHWVRTLNANIHMQTLKQDLANAQKKDMMSALQAQVDLETFCNDNETSYSGFLEKLSMKSQRNWKKRWFTLNDKGELAYFDTDLAKKPKQVLQVTYLSVMINADGARLDAPLVIDTLTRVADPAVISGATENALPMNFAIFDNEEATVDLSAVFNEQGEQVAIPEESLIQDQAIAAAEEEKTADTVRSTLVSNRPTLVGRIMSVRGAAVTEQETADVSSPSASSRSKSIKRSSQIVSFKGFAGKSSFQEDSFSVNNPAEEEAAPSPTTAAATVQEEELKVEDKEEEEESTPAMPTFNNAWGRPGAKPDRRSTEGGSRVPLNGQRISLLKPSQVKKDKNCSLM